MYNPFSSLTTVLQASFQIKKSGASLTIREVVTTFFTAVLMATALFLVAYFFIK